MFQHTRVFVRVFRLRVYLYASSQRILTGASSCRRSGVPKTVAIADQTPKGCLLSITETERGQRVSSARQIFTSSATASDYDKQRKIFAIKIDSLAPNMMHI
jgi:hypothetical protein